MDELKVASQLKHIGFISTRIAGTDGVSLGIEKWAAIMESVGLKCFYFAGELDRPDDKSYFAPEAHFTHPENCGNQSSLFWCDIERSRHYPKDS